MQKKWSGSGIHKLPALQVEPYRLWFEFLKLAIQDPDVDVDREHYSAWGDVENLTFTKWWSAHWRTLFSIDIGVYQLTDLSHKIVQSDQEIIVRIPLSQNIRRSLDQVEELLNDNGAGDRMKDMRDGQFRLYAGINEAGEMIHPSRRLLRNLDKIRLMMHLYRFWVHNYGLVNRRRLEQTAIGYFEWADNWNKKVARNIDGSYGKRIQIDIPDPIWYYVDYLKKRGDRRRVSLMDLNETDVPNARRQIDRYIKKACRIAQNVGRGEFTGIYEKSSGFDE
jgi:hypothetical protein